MYDQDNVNDMYLFNVVAVYADQPVSSASPPTRDKINGEEKARSRRRDWSDPAASPPATAPVTNTLHEDGNDYCFQQQTIH